MSAPLLELIGVHASYGAVQALKGVSLNVPEGDIVTLLGANGAGKSTTLLTISGIVRATAGEIRLAGKPIHSAAPHEIVAQGLAHVPEGRRIFAQMSVEENLLLGSYPRRDRSAVQSDLEGVYAQFAILKERRAQLGGTLSGGEQQMLAIGRAQMAKPRLLLLDEPSLGLAPKLVHQIFEGLRTIHALGTTILLVEQNARAALSMASYAYVFETGRVVLEGPSAVIAANSAVQEAYLGGG